jgi:hypothetical protein
MSETLREATLEPGAAKKSPSTQVPGVEDNLVESGTISIEIGRIIGWMPWLAL